MLPHLDAILIDRGENPFLAAHEPDGNWASGIAGYADSDNAGDCMQCVNYGGNRMALVAIITALFAVVVGFGRKIEP